jgi:4-amino-4-deoxy-L-arabinose transferase-like glycosyltransferase
MPQGESVLTRPSLARLILRSTAVTGIATDVCRQADVAGQPRQVGAALRTGWVLCVALVTVALLFRVVLMSTVFAGVDSDQAVLGIMAYHVQQGERPVFYSGQPYTGSLEAYLATLVFQVFGANDFTLRVPALLFSVACVGAVFWLGAVLYGYRIATLAALFVALAPSIMISWSLAAGANYIEIAFCGTVLLLLAVLYPDLRAMPLPVALLMGLIAGLGTWLQPMMGEYLVPVAVTYLLRLWVARPCTDTPGREAGRRTLVAALVAIAAGLAIGMAPLIIYNVRHPLATLVYFIRVSGGGNHLLVAERFVTESLPILLGFAMPAYGPTAFDQVAAGHRVVYVFGVLLGILALIGLLISRRGLVPRLAALARPSYGWAGAAALQVADDDRENGHRRAGRVLASDAGKWPAVSGCRAIDRVWDAGPSGSQLRWERPDADRDGVVALFAVVGVLFFVLSRFGAHFSSTSRPCYLIPLYTLTPLALDVFLPRKPGRGARWAAGLVVGVMVLSGLRLTLLTPPSHPVDGLVRLLERRHVRVVYTSYWLAYRIAFDSHERVHGISVRENLRLGLVRTPSDLQDAEHVPARGLAWMFFPHQLGERTFRALLRRQNIHADRTLWQGRVLYDHLSQPVRPAGTYRVHGVSPPES